MRNFINLIENSIVPHDPTMAQTGELAGPSREDMTLDQAKDYLNSYPDGVLHHPGFETDSFVAVTRYGMYVFFNSNTNKIEHWDWKEDIEALLKYYAEDDTYNPMTDWWYHDGWYQMGDTANGIEFWNRIRNGLEIPE